MKIYESDEVVFYEGDVLFVCFYLLVMGFLWFIKIFELGKEIILRLLRVDEVFVVLVLFGNGVVFVIVIVLELIKVLIIEREVLLNGFWEVLEMVLYMLGIFN